MAKFKFDHAAAVIRASDVASKGNLDVFVRRLVEHIRHQDSNFYLITKNITGADFNDEYEVYGWFYRYFVGE